MLRKDDTQEDMHDTGGIPGAEDWGGRRRRRKRRREKCPIL